MAEPQAYDPEKLTAGVTWKWKKTISDGVPAVQYDAPQIHAIQIGQAGVCWITWH